MKTCIEAVSNPIAQTTKLCNSSSRLEPEKLTRLGVDMYLQLRDFRLYAIYLIQSEYALRISEVLSISHRNITSKGHILIKACKGSADRFIFISDIKFWLLQCKESLINPFDGMNRFYVYREFKKLGINSDIEYGTKKAITHGFRYKKVTELHEISDDLELSKQFLGHKSINSTKHYESKRKK